VSSLSVALRLARRDVRSAKGRSALVVAMIALPVLGVSAADVLYRSFQLSPEQKAVREMGAADALLTDSGQVQVEQTPSVGGVGWSSSGDRPRVGPPPSYTSVLPPGSRVLVEHADDGQTSVTYRGATTRVRATDLDLRAPLARGLYRWVAGRTAHDGQEAVITGGLGRRLGVHLGAELELSGPRLKGVRTIVGIVENPQSLGERSVLLPPGSMAEGPVGRVFVDVQGTLTWADVRRANAKGMLLQPRGHVPGEPVLPAQYASAIRASTITAISLVVGMALLEVVLLAGPAFAVGAKRRTRELALLAATGAERRHVRRTVLAGGVVLGAVGGVLGTAGGVGLAALALPHLARLNGSLPGPFEARALELLAVAVVGVLTAVLAAVIPARAASKQDVVAGLTGRRGTVRSLRRTPVLGVLAAGLGAALAMDGARRRDVNVILAGSALAELGVVATTPSLVGLAGRLGAFLPLAPRLALRDAARNRGRTAPAVSAILAAVAGSVAVATYVASLDRHDRESYTPQAPYGNTWVLLDGASSSAAAAAQEALRTHLPHAQVVAVRALGPGPSEGMGDTGWVDVAAAGPCPLARQTSCRSGNFSGVLVGDAAMVHAVTGLTGAALDRADAVLRRGGAVVPETSLRPDGTAVLQIHPPNSDVRIAKRIVVPAVALPADALPAYVVGTRAAARVGLPTHLLAAVAAASEPPTGQQEDRLRGSLNQIDLGGVVFLERGYRSAYGIGLLALAVGSAVIVLGASGIATGLAAADGRADLATLAAVGASPRTRRTLAAFQSATTAGLGTMLGAAAGLVPAVAILRATTKTVAYVDGRPELAPGLPIVLPWANIAATLLVVPLLAAAAAALLTRSRLPMVQRVG